MRVLVAKPIERRVGSLESRPLLSATSPREVTFPKGAPRVTWRGLVEERKGKIILGAECCRYNVCFECQHRSDANVFNL